MKEINMDYYFEALMPLLDHVVISQSDNIKKCSEICAQCIKEDGVIHVFGSGHSVGFGLEMIHRVGSLIPIHNIELTDFVLKGKVSLEEFRDPNNNFERRANVADKLYELYDIKPNDVFIIISNSGINGVVIDLAITAKKKGHKIIVVTSMIHTMAEVSRHPSGKKLYEYGDVVIDNCGPQGDAFLESDGVEKVCSVSSITGALIAQSISSEIIFRLMGECELPVVTEDYYVHQKCMKKYEGRI